MSSNATDHRRVPAARMLAAVFAFVLTAAVMMPGPSHASSADPMISVIVEQVEGAGLSVQDAVDDLGGTVGHVFGIIDGFAAEIPSSALPELRSHPGVLTATPDDVAACPTPLLVAMGNDLYHPQSTSRVIAEQAPNVTFVEEWKEGDALVDFDPIVKAFLAEQTP